VLSLTRISKILFLSPIWCIFDFGIQIFTPLSTNIAFSVSCRIRTGLHIYLTSGWLRLPRLPSEGSQWQENVRPEHWLTSLRICKLLLRFFYWCVNSWLFPHSSFRADAVELLSWIVFDINRTGEQEVFWYGWLFHQRFELVATASATNTNPNRKASLITKQAYRYDPLWSG